MRRPILPVLLGASALVVLLQPAPSALARPSSAGAVGHASREVGRWGGALRAPLSHDCNGNGVEDAVDIALGTSVDANANAIPDECEGLAPGAGE